MTSPQYPGNFPSEGYNPPIPQQPDFRKSNRLIFIILGSVMAVILILFIAGFSFFNSLSSNETDKIRKMEAIASRITPGDDWTLKYSMDPKVDPTCIPSNVACHRLQRMWEMPDPVSSADLEEMLGIRFEEKASWRGCSVGKEDGLRIEVCNPDGDSPQVNLSIQD